MFYNELNFNNRSFNPFVVGSIPARPTNIIRGLRENVTLCQLISSRIVVLIDNYNHLDRPSEISFEAATSVD